VEPIERLDAAVAARLVGLVFDLDDTVLDRGELGLAAYGALFRMREAGLRLVACTGRPSGWAEVVARMWPVDAAIAENGAVAWRKSGPGRVELVDPVPPDVRAARGAALACLARDVLAAHPELSLADDVAARRTDVAFDVAERRCVPPDVVAAARARIRAAGARTFLSSVHLHATFEAADKASGTVALLRVAFGEEPTAALGRWGFVGDSENDGAAFAAFDHTFGVANVRARAHGMTRPPRWVAPSPGGLGFAAIAAALVARRSPCAGGRGE
jgi:HAD superfamily hydrolase (TIGR01484 family)